MKNNFKLIGIIAIAALIAFTFTACGPKTIPTSFRFRNAAPPANLSMHSVSGPISGTTIDKESYAEIEAFYADYPNVIKTFTPAAFTMYENSIEADVNGYLYPLIANSYRLIDFVQGTTINVDDVPADEFTDIMLVSYVLKKNELAPGSTLPHPTTTFTVPNLHPEHEFKASSMYNDGELWSVNDDNTITVATYYLFPLGWHVPSPHFLYTGTEYRYQKETTWGTLTNIGPSFVTPWAGHSTSGSSITFNVNWNTNNLIEQRCAEGSGDEHSCKDCVFVLAENFWERFSFTVN